MTNEEQLSQLNLPDENDFEPDEIKVAPGSYADLLLRKLRGEPLTAEEHARVAAEMEANRAARDQRRKAREAMRKKREEYDDDF